MKTASLTYLRQHFIDLAPFGVSFWVLTQTVLAFIAAMGLETGSEDSNFVIPQRRQSYSLA